MNKTYKTRADQVAQREVLTGLAHDAGVDLDQVREDTEVMEEEIRQFQLDGTGDDRRAIQNSIAVLQEAIKRRTYDLLTASEEVTAKLDDFERGAESAAERARCDAERIADLRQEINNTETFDVRLKRLQFNKINSESFQERELSNMQSVDEGLMRVYRHTRLVVQAAVGRRW